jgi:hypothetical protein
MNCTTRMISNPHRVDSQFNSVCACGTILVKANFNAPGFYLLCQRCAVAWQLPDEYAPKPKKGKT